MSSPERLLDETSLFLHRVEASCRRRSGGCCEQLHSADAVFDGQEDPDRRRRRAERLRADERARGATAWRCSTRRTARTRIEAPRGRPGRRHRPDGHHDAGAGRLRDDPAHPRDAAVRAAADHLPHGEGDEGRPREVDRRGRLRLHHQAGGHRPAPLADARMAVRPQRGDRPDGRRQRGARSISRRSSSTAFSRRSTGTTASTSGSTRRPRSGAASGGACSRGAAETISALQDQLLHDPDVMQRLLLDLSINVTAMFRDPTLLPRVPREGRAAAAHVSVQPDLGRGLLDGRGGLLAGDPARGGGAVRADEDLCDGHQRGGARARAARRLPAREDAGLHAQLHRRGRQARVLRLLHVARTTGRRSTGR